MGFTGSVWFGLGNEKKREKIDLASEPVPCTPAQRKVGSKPYLPSGDVLKVKKKTVPFSFRLSFSIIVFIITSQGFSRKQPLYSLR